MTSCILQDIINDININTMLYYCVPLESVLDNGYCFKPFLYLIFILYCISFADIISIWEILRADVILFSIAHTNLKSMTMPYLGRVPSPGWKRACNVISHPGMWKVEGRGGYIQVSFPWSCRMLKPFSWIVYLTGSAWFIKVTPSPPNSIPQQSGPECLAVCILDVLFTFID